MRQELVIINGTTGEVVALEEDDHGRRPHDGHFGTTTSRYAASDWKRPYRELLRRISLVELAKNKSLLEHYIERAYEDDGILKDLMGKLLPTKKFVEGDGINIMAEEMSGELRRVLAVIQGGRKPEPVGGGNGNGGNGAKKSDR